MDLLHIGIRRNVGKMSTLKRVEKIKILSLEETGLALLAIENELSGCNEIWRRRCQWTDNLVS